MKVFFPDLIDFDLEFDVLPVEVEILSGEGQRDSLVVDWNVEGH